MHAERSSLFTPQIELKHYPFHDLLLNRDAITKEQADALTAQFSQGLPASWPSFKRNPDDYASHLFSDDSENPTYFAKIKKNVSRTYWREAMDKRTVYGEDVFIHERSHNSLMNELVLSPRIAELVTADDAQHLAHDQGFLDMVYVKPLLGVIEKRTGQKIMVYPWINGYSTFSENNPQRELIDNLTFETKTEECFIDRLSDYFADHGIIAQDLDSVQFLTDNRTLYLIDIEGYRKRDAILTS